MLFHAMVFETKKSIRLFFKALIESDLNHIAEIQAELVLIHRKFILIVLIMRPLQCGPVRR